MFVLLLSFIALADPQQEQANFLIENIRIVDGNGDQGIHNIQITGTRISALDPQDLPEDTKYDGSGKTLLPGLMILMYISP